MENPGLAANLSNVQKRIELACRRSGRDPAQVTLIAITKTVDPLLIETAYHLGIRHFGENRVQEAALKIRDLPHLDPIPAWHMVGHLQSNKVKTALDVFDVIQSIHSLDLAEAIQKRANRKIQVFLQVNVTGEVSKSGFALTEIEPAFKSISELSRLNIGGLMTIAPLVSDPEKVRPVFKEMKKLSDYFHLKHLSMGMTDDFEVAIEEGATIVRIGRAIFGAR